MPAVLAGAIKGLTLVELLLVIIILGILITLGFAQYQGMLEKGRGAEARTALGTIRTIAADLWLQNIATTGNVNSIPAGTFTNNAVGIGNAANLIPGTCTDTTSGAYFFSYAIADNVVNNNTVGFVATATRCIGAQGKQPGGTFLPGGGARVLVLTSDFTLGSDVWSSTGGY